MRRYWLSIDLLSSQFNLTALALAVLIGVITAISPAVGVLFVPVLAYSIYAFTKPMINAYVVIVAIVLTSGMARGALIPALIPNELVLAGVTALCLPYILTARLRAGQASVEVLVASGVLIAGTIAIPLLAFWIRGLPVEPHELFTLLAPCQYLLLFIIFKYLPRTERDRRQIIWLMLFMSCFVAIVGLLQALGIGIVQDTLARWYPSGQLNVASQFGRITSLLAAWNALGTFMMVNLLLARAYLLPEVQVRNRRALYLMMALLFVCMVASGSYASIIGLVLGLLIIESYDKRRRFKRLLAAAVIAVLAYVILQPLISERFAYQSRGESVVPETLSFRFEIWNDVFLPLLRDHWLWGVRPSIPLDSDWQWAESQYLLLVYRGGVFALVGHLAWVGMILIWLRRVITRSTGGAHAAAIAGSTALIALSVMAFTNEVFTFSGVNDFIWILWGVAANSDF